MNFKTLGNFVLLASFIALGIAAYLYFSVHNEEYAKQEIEMVYKRVNGDRTGFTGGARLAAQKERAESNSLVFGSVGGLLLLIGLGVRMSDKERLEASKKCPFCAELVKPDATTCRFCQKDFPPLPTASVSTPVE